MWPDEVKTFASGDRVQCTFNGKTGIVESARYNCFYQLVWKVHFDDGETREIVTHQLRKI